MPGRSSGYSPTSAPDDSPGEPISTTATTAQATVSRLAKCAGAKNPNLVDVVDVQSPNFDQGQTEVSSDVTMVKTHADGMADLHALQSPKLDACVEQIAVPELKTALPHGGDTV
jgi:hypothetical protein